MYHRDAGRIRYLGVSNFTADQTENASRDVILHSSQPRYNLFFRDVEAEVLPACERNGIGVIAHSVLAKGLLGGKYLPGHEFEQDDQVSKAVYQLKKQGGQILFHAGETHYASTDLLRDNLPDIHKQHTQLFKQACDRQKLKLEELQECIDKFKDAALLVIGDTIVDQYVACDPMGMSNEAPVVVVKELETRDFIGGAAIVAGHVASLGANCTYLSVLE